MRRYLGYMGIVVIAYTFFICLGTGISGFDALHEKSNSVFLAFEIPEISMSAFQDIKEREEKAEDFLDPVGWYKRQDKVISYREFNRSVSSEVIYLTGKSNFLTGSTLTFSEDDERGCIISSGLSYELLGTTEGKGMTVECEGRSFIVRDVIPADANLLYVQHRKEYGMEEEQMLEGVAIGINEGRGQTAYSVSQLFMSRYGITKVTVLDIVFCKRLASVLKNMVPIFCIGFWGVFFVKRAREWKRKPFVFGMVLFGTILFIKFSLYIFEISFCIPDEMIPTKWSDFEFWSEIFQNYKAQLDLLLRSGNVYPFKPYADWLFQMGVYNLLSGLLLFALHYLMETLQTQRIAVWVVVFILLAYYAFLHLLGNEILLDHSRLLFWILPYHFGILGLKKHQIA